MFKKIILFLMLFCIASIVNAHGGRTNSQDCHNKNLQVGYIVMVVHPSQS